MENRAMNSILMKLLFLLITATSVIAQEHQRIKMTVDFPKDENLTQLLQFQNIELCNITFRGAGLKNRNYYITAREIWNGKVKTTDTLISSIKLGVGPIFTDSLHITLISGKSSEKKLKIGFRFEEFGFSREFKCTNSTDYSLRSVGEAINIEPGNPFYALAWILPYEKDGYKHWCAVEKSGEDIGNWGAAFDIDHYILFEMNFY